MLNNDTYSRLPVEILAWGKGLMGAGDQRVICYNIWRCLNEARNINKKQVKIALLSIIFQNIGRICTICENYKMYPKSMGQFQPAKKQSKKYKHKRFRKYKGLAMLKKPKTLKFYGYIAFHKQYIFYQKIYLFFNRLKLAGPLTLAQTILILDSQR